ncbi:MAG: leucyl aminopeptidase [Polyangiaceae bacterium]|nr:leucyl aminopeptidase [Polyangiaceae bacterium]
MPSYHASAQAALEPAPSRKKAGIAKANVSKSIPAGAGAVGVPVGVDGDVPTELGLDRAALAAAGFEGKIGQTLIVPRTGRAALVAIGIGPRDELNATSLRDAAAAFARAAQRHGHIATLLPAGNGLAPEAAAQAIVEGALLARYRYSPLKHRPEHEPPLDELTLVGGSDPAAALEDGILRGLTTTRAGELARDLANAPATLLTARRMADIAKGLAKDGGLDITIFDEKELLELGCGGLLGVNAGSDEPPRLIKLTYQPKITKGTSTTPVGHVALIGKGIMYDSGGISLKPNDLVHATMKVDMTGAAAILSAMSALRALGCNTAVTGYLMCTDNMPSGKAMKLGDVLTIRGGKTVEVLNTDAEGRLVMADGLVMATEQKPKPDAIVDIATLTGACQRALGKARGGVMGNNQALVDQLRCAGDRTDETLWQLPLDRRYRNELDSEIADIKNIGGEDAGAITAALFLEEFVGGLPWAHIDIAGTAQINADDSWRTKGATGFGARLLIDFLMEFSPPSRSTH